MNAPIIFREPAMTFQASPLEAPSAPKAVKVGANIYELAPTRTARCYLNGEPVYRMTEGQINHYKKLTKRGDRAAAQEYLAKAATDARNWKEVKAAPNDVIEFRDEPGDKEDFRVILQIAAVVVTIATYGTTSAWLGAAFAAVNVAYNLLVPPSPLQQQEEEAANSVYTANLSGNAARLDQPIWKNCGLVPITPPFAAQPYLEFVDSGKTDGAGRPIDTDQYYYALFCLGIGNHVVKSVYIGKTPIFNFDDVTVSKYLAPGELPSVALASVVTSPEVSQMEMLEADYVGAFVACKPRQRALAIGIDMMCPTGLGAQAEDGDVEMSWRVEYQEIDDYGRIIGPWTILGDQSHTLNTNTPQRFSNKYDLPSPMRVQIRCARSSPKDEDVAVRNDLNWIGLRAYLANPAPLNPDAAHYEIVMRASKQLSGASQHDFRMYVAGMCRTWSVGGGWGPEIETRNPGWWLLDLKTSTTWGEGKPESAINMKGFADFAAICEARQDRFDFTFSNRSSAAAGAQLIARAGRARCFQHYGLDTIARDELATLPVTAFTHRNAANMRITEKLPTLDYADGVIIEYTSNVTWSTEFIECPCPGFTVTDTLSPRYNAALPMMERPVYMTLTGIMGAHQAEREGLYEAAVILYRTRTVSCEVEMDAILCSYMSPVRWLPEIAGYGQTGDVVEWDGGSVVTISERADFSKGTTLITFVRDDGSLTEAAIVSPGATPFEVVLPGVPDFPLTYASGIRERTRYLLGTLADCDELVKVTSIGPSDGGDGDDDAPPQQVYTISGLIDDQRIHAVDNFLLPGPGDIQDPVSFPEEDTSGGTLVFVRLSVHNIDDGNHPTGDGGGGGTDGFPKIEFRNDGTLWIHQPGNYPGTSPFMQDDEWLLHAPFDPSIAADFEILAHVDSGSPTTGDVVDTWLNMGTTREWQISGQYSVTYLRIKIRRVGDTVLQAEKVMWMTVH